MLRFKNYVRVQSLEEAYQLNQKKGNVILGGMLWLKMQSKNVNTAIDLRDLGLNKITETEEEFVIGAMTTLRQIETDESFLRYTSGQSREAVRHIVGVQFRNLATVGGRIFGRFGFGDVLTFFMALDTEVELYHAGRMPLTQFAEQGGGKDILVALHVKKKPIKISYRTVRNSKTDFPVLAVAVSEMEGLLRVSVGARPARGILWSQQPGETRESFLARTQSEIPVGSNMRASAAYRRHLLGVLLRRCVSSIEEVKG